MSTLIKNKVEAEQQKQDKASCNKRLDIQKRHTAILTVQKAKGRGEDTGFANWTQKEMEIYIQYKKKKGNPKMPKTLAKVKQQCIDWSYCSSLSPPPLPSNNELSINQDGSVDGNENNDNPLEFFEC